MLLLVSENSGLSGGGREYNERARDTRAHDLPDVTIRWLLHPITWTKWRIEVHKQGPYAPDFNDFLRKCHESSETWGAGGNPIEPE